MWSVRAMIRISRSCRVLSSRSSGAGIAQRFPAFQRRRASQELVARLGSPDLPGLDQPYSPEEKMKLNSLLSLVYPSVGRLAEFLLQGKQEIGGALPLLGLFSDPKLTLDLPSRQWLASLLENQDAAVLRWRDFAQQRHEYQSRTGSAGSGPAYRLARRRNGTVGQGRRAEGPNLTDALSVLNPPTHLVAQIVVPASRGSRPKSW